MLKERIARSIKLAIDEALQIGAEYRYRSELSENLNCSLSQLHKGAACMLTCSGAAAMEVALRASKVGAKSEVILSAYDYPGNFWAIERVGARPVLVDVVEQSWSIDIGKLEAARTAETQAMIVSHLHGELQDVRGIRKWADRYGITLIEDACQALGATIEKHPVGTFGHFGVLSFGGGKVLSAGRGGALLAEDEELLQRARIAAGAGSGPYELSELQSAVILAQLAYLPEITQQCRKYFFELQQQLVAAGLELRFPSHRQIGETAYYQAGWIVNTDESKRGAVAQAVVERLQVKGISAGRGFAGFHRRSERRCRHVDALQRVAGVVDATWVIHHSAAIQAIVPAAELAAEIAVAQSNVKG